MGRSEPESTNHSVVMQAYVDSKGTQLELGFKNFRQFVTELGPNISADGLFVETTAPAEVGTILDFSLRLEGGHPLIHGRGRVAWVRAAKDSPDPPPGMALTFLEIAQSTPDLIEKLIEAHQAEGGEPFDPMKGPGEEAAMPQEAPTPPAGLAAAEAAPPSKPPLDVALTQEISVPSDPPPKPKSAVDRGASPPPPFIDGTAEPQADAQVPFSMGEKRPERGSIARPPEATSIQAPQARFQGMAAASRHRLRATPSLIFLLVASGVVGGLTYRLTETLVYLMTDESGGTEVSAFADIPPPESLRATARAASTAGSAAATEDGAGAVSAAVEPTTESSPPAKRTAATGSPSPAGPPLTRIRFINWRLQPDGLGTEVILTGDGPITADRYEQTSIGGRLLVKILDVDWPYPKRVIQVATPQLARIRTGFHHRPDGNELHIVLDLARPGASLREIRSEGNRLRLSIG